MAKGRGTKKNEPVTNENSETRSVSEQQVDAKIETLTNRFDDLLGVVKNMSIQLEEITSGKKGLLNNGKDIAADSNSTQPVSDSVIEFQEDVVEKFHSLKQTDTVAEYQRRFLELTDLLMTMNYGLREDYLISSFLSGLKAEIRVLVRKPKPETLYHAVNLARLQEIAIEVEKDKLRASITRKMEENNCWPPNRVDLYVTHDYPQKIQGLVGKRVLSTIISCGVACNFMDTKAAIEAGCKMEEAEPLFLTFVFGCYQAVSKFKCCGFKWTIQGHEFVADVRIVELRACDMVLGRQWEYDYRAETNLSQNRVTLYKEGKKIVLKIPENQINCASNEQK